MNKRLRIALIGAGGIGHQWASALSGAKGVALVAVADTDEAKARAIAKDFPGCRAVKGWKQIMADGEIDAVLIATPHKWLAPISYAALAAGKHVLCEKPAGISSAEVAKNIALAKKKKLAYMIGFNHRYHPAYMQAMEIFKKGGIGKIDFIRARYGFGGRPGYGKEWRFDKKIAGGGELLDQGMHMIDMARWFMGDFAQVEGFAQNYFWGGEVEDNGFALLRTARGQVASIHVSWTNWEWVHSFEIGGDKGYLQIDALDQRYNGPERLTWGRRDPTFAKPRIEEYIFGEEGKHDSLRREMQSFVNASTSAAARTLLPRGEDAHAALCIVEQIYKKQHGKSKK